MTTPWDVIAAKTGFAVFGAKLTAVADDNQPCWTVAGCDDVIIGVRCLKSSLDQNIP
jgi:hypothetical protein